MSQENVEVFKRGVEAGNRRDVEALLAELDPAVEWHPVLTTTLGGEATVYRGHKGVRELFRDVYEVLTDFQAEVLETRDLGDRLVASGRMRASGRASGAETVSPVGWVVDFENGKVIRIRSYFDPKEALEAAGLRT
jgi:ketosteroid isomerase-like protein